MRCAASVRLRQHDAVLPGESEAALEGTAAHWAAAQILEHGREHIGAVHQGVTLDEEMYRHVRVYTEAVRAVNAEWRLFEERLAMPSIHAQAFGTADAVLLNNMQKHITVFDFKYGYRPVEEFENWQGICYAAGVLDRFALSEEWTVEFVVAQPRAYHRNGPIRSWNTTASAIRVHTQRLAEQARVALESNSPPARVGAWCKYCEARHFCSAAQTAALSAMDTVYEGAADPLSPEALSLELRLLRQAQERLAHRLTGLEAQAMVEIQAGKVVPGWSVDHPPGRETWTRPVGEVVALGNLFGKQLGKLEPITPKQARDLGVPAEMVRAMSTRKTSEAKLVEVNTTAARKVFGNG